MARRSRADAREGSRVNAEKPEGEGWLTPRQAGRMLGVSVAMIRFLVWVKKLAQVRVGKYAWFHTREVERLARDPDRLRHQANVARNQAGRRLADIRDAPGRLLDTGATCRLLGIVAPTLSYFVGRGRLTIYRDGSGKSRKHWYLESEVEALRQARIEKEAGREAKRQEKANAPGPKVTQVSTREWKRKEQGRIDPGDLGEFERYLGEWLTARQAAMLLNLAETSVHNLRRNGRLTGYRREHIVLGRVQWHYRKADVSALMEERKYFAHRARYENHCTAEAKAKKKAEAEAANLTACVEANRRHGSFVNEWLREQKW